MAEEGEFCVVIGGAYVNRVGLVGTWHDKYQRVRNVTLLNTNKKTPVINVTIHKQYLVDVSAINNIYSNYIQNEKSSVNSETILQE